MDEEEWEDEDDMFEIQIPQGFSVTDERSAEWVLRRIAEEEAAGQHAIEWSSRIQAQTTKNKSRLLELFGVGLQRYAEGRLEGGKKKSFELPSGKLGFRKKKTSLEFKDTEILLLWAKVHCPEAVRVRLTVTCGHDDAGLIRDQANKLVEEGYTPTVQDFLVKTPLNDLLQKEGVLPDGCKIIPEHEVFQLNGKAAFIEEDEDGG